MTAPHILVVEDEEHIAQGLVFNLEQEGYRVTHAETGSAAMQVFDSERFDLVVLDLMLPDQDGFEILRHLRHGGDDVPVIILTARDDDVDVVVGLELGADDYVTKPFNPGEVVARVRAVLRRAQGDAAPPRVIRAGHVTIDLDRHQVEVGGEPVHLTRTEFSLLRALAEQPGRPLTRLEMIEKGLGYSYEGMDRTVDSHIKNLRRKLDEAGGAARQVETVFGIGYRLAVGENSA